MTALDVFDGFDRTMKKLCELKGLTSVEFEYLSDFPERCWVVRCFLTNEACPVTGSGPTLADAMDRALRKRK
jgi:hypothetical protein